MNTKMFLATSEKPLREWLSSFFDVRTAYLNDELIGSMVDYSELTEDLVIGVAKRIEKEFATSFGNYSNRVLIKKDGEDEEGVISTVTVELKSKDIVFPTNYPQFFTFDKDGKTYAFFEQGNYNPNYLRNGDPGFEVWFDQVMNFIKCNKARMFIGEYYKRIYL